MSQFKALLLEEMDGKVSSSIQTLDDDRLPEGEVTVGIKYSTLNFKDGMVINGGAYTGGIVHSHDDHRIAMAFSMAALKAAGSIHIEECDNVNTSFPDYVELASEAGLNIEKQ